MPVAQGGPPPARQALTVGVAALLGLLALVFLVTRFDRLGGGSTQVELGGHELPLGSTADLADAVAETGPLLFPGPAGAGRDIWLQHLGPGDRVGWVAFSARADGADLDCVTEWRADDDTFVDSCDGTVYPAGGDGLRAYPVVVDEDGDLVLELSPLP